MNQIAMADADSGGGRKNLSNTAYRIITRLIRSRHLKGGETIIEASLANQLNISRTPLREALQKLEGEGLVVKGTGRSFVVRHVDLGEYLQSLRVREILEPHAGAMAIGRIPAAEIELMRNEINNLGDAMHTDEHWCSDDNLHELFARHCGNEVLANVIRGLRVTTRLFEIAQLADRVEMDAAEHRKILAAFEAGDVEAVRETIRAHIQSIGDFAVATVR